MKDRGQYQLCYAVLIQPQDSLSSLAEQGGLEESCQIAGQKCRNLYQDPLRGALSGSL